MRPRWAVLTLLTSGACTSGPPCGAAAAREEAAVYAAVVDSLYVRTPAAHGGRIPPERPREAVVLVRPFPVGPETPAITGSMGTPEPDHPWQRLVGLSLRERFALPAEFWLVPGSLFAGYRAANIQPGPPPPEPLMPGLRVTLLGPGDLARLLPSAYGPLDPARFDPAGDWRRFAAAHPYAHGLLQVSRVGFDRACGRALVGLSHSSGDGNVRPATAGYVFLERAEAGWRIWRTLGTFD